MRKKIAIIGGGFGGLSSAALLAQRGYDVSLYEKNSETGGRARYFSQNGYRFDMGPSWYLMPEVFERFFSIFGKQTSDYYSLKKLQTSYRVFFGADESVDVNSDAERVAKLFESLEEGGGTRIAQYLKQAKYKYNTAMESFLYKDYRKITDFFDKQIMTQGLKMNLFGKLDKFTSNFFTDIRAKQILEYAMVFLGTSPIDAPAMYSIMSHVDLTQGVYYPEGGLAGVAQSFSALAEEQGAAIHTSSAVEKILVENGKARGIQVNGEKIEADAVLVNADYAHAELNLIPKE